ncbi:DHA2 family efflux MFS transporter permease subunit [uncultured Amnibacterium sp.]|uniref:MDR family MFS transporter n=1 Tax=uncultured Amnibacterium sp. TaxID=1631851 RepID=UPI0035CAE0F3
MFVTATQTAPSTGAVMSHRQILLVIYGLMAGMFLSALDQTVVGTAIRTIGDDLHGLDQQAWVTTAYLITSTIATPIYGKLSDIFGRRPLIIFAISIFVAGSLASSFSTSMLMLAGFRAVQGIGAGGLMSLPLAIMGDMLAPRERAKYQGYFLAVFGVSSVIGPLVGGVLSGAPQILFITGWRWVFLINVPIGAAALLMVLAFLHLPRFGTRSVRIDWWGATAVIATLVPLLLVAEQGRTWGWGSAGSIACYVVGGLGLIGFLIAETLMKDDAIIPLKLFRSRVFSMATILGVLVGFGMFGALLTLPLYLQVVTGLSATASGFATLPMVLGLMIAAITSGQIVSRTGKYRIFPITGTAFTSAGFFFMTTLTIDKPLWYLMIGMFLIGLGLGQLMQTLTLASQNSVQPKDMGVATSASTFFRQIGGTLGTAILLSVLFSSLPGNILTATGDKATLTSAVDAALTPSVADKASNAAIMKQLWNPIVNPIKSQVQAQLDTATTAITSSGASAAQQTVLLEQAAAKANAGVVDGRLTVDYTNATQRRAIVDQVVPGIITQIKQGSGSSTSSTTSATSDTSFLKGADPRLSKPFLTGFNVSAVQIYWVGLAVLLIAFVIALFFKVPPLRQRSALQEQADNEAASKLEVSEANAAAAVGTTAPADTGAVPAGRR